MYGCLPPAADADPAGGGSLPESLPPLRLSEVLSGPEEADAACGTAAARQAALLAAVRLVGRLAALLHDAVAFPELFSPARKALEALHARPGVHRVRRSLKRLLPTWSALQAGFAVPVCGRCVHWHLSAVLNPSGAHPDLL